MQARARGHTAHQSNGLALYKILRYYHIHSFAFDARAPLTLKDVAISSDHLQLMVENERAQEGPFFRWFIKKNEVWFSKGSKAMNPYMQRTCHEQQS